MLRHLVAFQDRILNFGRNESGQDAFEYLLVIGVIMVAVVAAVKAGGPGAAGAVWTAVQTAVVNAA
jgi:Flp pilus assembly pilin Flp